jgi:diguanylate cyclase (GGDEF)-like protein/PAS domain S-box-containing protein
MKQELTRSHYFLLAIGFVVFSTMAVTIALWSDYQKINTEFQSDVNNINRTLSQRLSSMETVLISLSGLHHASDAVNVAELAAFSEELLSAYPFIDAILGMEKVPLNRRSEFERRMQQEGFINLKIKPFDKNQSAKVTSFLPIDFLEPMTPISSRILGLDISSMKGTELAIDRAISTGRISASKPLENFIQQAPVILLFKSIYSGRYPPDTEEEKQSMFIRLVALQINPQRFMNTILSNHNVKGHIQEIVDTKNSQSLEITSHNNKANQKNQFRLSSLTHQNQFSSYGKTYQLTLSRALNFEMINPWRLFTSWIIAMFLLGLIASQYKHRRMLQLKEKETSRILLEEGQRFSHVIDTAFDAVVTLNDQGKVVSWNQQATKLFGYSKQDVIKNLFFPLILSSNELKNHSHLLNGLFLNKPQSSPVSFQTEMMAKDNKGNVFPIEMAVSSSFIGESFILSIFLRDISERKASESQIRHLAYYDSLTGLPNRLAFKDQARSAIKSAERNTRTGAVLYLDLDEFKRINDTLGHDIGDELLKKVAARLIEQVRDSDSITFNNAAAKKQNVARLGGDEFTVLLREINQPEDACTVALRIQQSIGQPFNLLEHEVYVTPSIGIAVFPHDANDVEQLLKHADTAMYYAKELGKNTYQFYSQQMSIKVEERLKLEGQLRKALENDEFRLYYQPQIDLQSNKIVGAEALIRWQQGELGMIPPDQFIPLAEETGLIFEIGEWVLREACLQNKVWQNEGYTPIRLSVNLSGVQFIQRDLSENILEILSITELSPEYLELEITESIMMRNIQETITTLKEFNEMGLKTAIDDFGTGYSSLSYLKKFPLEYLKIDKSFVSDIPEDKDDVMITTAIISLAKSLNLKIVAEGVENQEQVDFLTEQQCDLMQGYFFSKAVPADEFEKLLRAQS